MARVVYGETKKLDQDGRWAAHAIYAEDDTGMLTPIGLEVRPARLAPDGDGPWVPVSGAVVLGDLPDEGFPLHLLRGFEWTEREEQVKEAWQDIERELGEVYSYGPDRVVIYLREVAGKAVARGFLIQTRRDLARSLFALLEASVEKAGGAPRSRQEVVDAVQRVYSDFDTNELRATIQWARNLQPPLFEPYGARQRGGRLTQEAHRLLDLADPLEALEPHEREEVEANRRRGLDS